MKNIKTSSYLTEAANPLPCDGFSASNPHPDGLACGGPESAVREGDRRVTAEVGSSSSVGSYFLGRRQRIVSTSRQFNIKDFFIPTSTQLDST